MRHPPPDRIALAVSRLVPEIQGFLRTPMEVIGALGGVVSVISYRDGTDVRVRLRPGPATWDSITVRRTGTGAPRLWKWWKETVEGSERRRNVLVRHLDDRGAEVARWTLTGCWPIRWHIVPTAEKTGNTIHVEELTLAVEAMDLG
jgi:phage tail-like protein